MKPHIEDPKWTAYALGELPAAEQAEAEALLADHPALREEVAALRDTLQILQSEFSQPSPVLDPLRREMLLRLSGNLKTMPRWIWLPSAAAALLAFALGISHYLRMPPSPAGELTEFPADTMSDKADTPDLEAAAPFDRDLPAAAAAPAAEDAFMRSAPAAPPPVIVGQETVPARSGRQEAVADVMRHRSLTVAGPEKEADIVGDADGLTEALVAPTPTPTPTPTPAPAPGMP